MRATHNTISALKHASDVEVAVSQLYAADKVMPALIDKYGVCPLKPWRRDAFDMLIYSIVGQQLSTKAAATIVQRVRALFPDDKKFLANKFAQLSQQELRNCGLSLSKANYCLGIATAVSNNTINLRALKRQSDEQVITELTALKGVGQWTAEMLLIFAFGRSDILSLGDLGLRRGMQAAYKLRKRPSDERFTKIAKAWQPYRSIASWYLWRAAE